MRLRKTSLAVSMALVASQAQADEHWVKFATDTAGHSYAIDASDFRKGIDGLVFFSDSRDGGATYISVAIDCRHRVKYVLGSSDVNVPDWRRHGSPVKAGSVGEVEMNLICTQIGSDPLPGNWVRIGFGESVDKDSIQRGSDAFVYFTDYDDTFHVPSHHAADCQRRLIYFLLNAGWKDRGISPGPKTFAEAELNFVCANVH